MTDRYANIRRALEMRPTPGPWLLFPRNVRRKPAVQRGKQGGFVVQGLSPEAEDADAAHIAACDPDTIRELLAERDALDRENEAMKRCAIKYLGWLGVTHMPLDEALREDMSDPTMCGDAAIAAANGGGNG